jgi:hypothetical protein
MTPLPKSPLARTAVKWLASAACFFLAIPVLSMMSYVLTGEVMVENQRALASVFLAVCFAIAFIVVGLAASIKEDL